jgi:hypothetical protein
VLDRRRADIARQHSRVLVASWDGGGNALSAVNLCVRLAQQGNRVRLLGWRSMTGRAIAAGLEFHVYASLPWWPPRMALEDAWVELVRPALHGGGTFGDICREAADFGADVVVADCMMGAALEAAASLGLPYAVLVHVPYAPFLNEWGSTNRRSTRNKLISGADVVLALTPPGFDVPWRSPGNTKYVGPITNPQPVRIVRRDAKRIARDGDPWVLVSLGTTSQKQINVLPRILEAVAALPVRVMLTLGEVLPAGALSMPPNVILRKFVPHELILPHMAMVICHGGLGTISYSLAAGVPVACIPHGRDQFYNAERVAACHVGRYLGTGASVESIAETIKYLIADPVSRLEARKFATVISELGRGEVAARQITALGMLRQ